MYIYTGPLAQLRHVVLRLLLLRAAPLHLLRHHGVQLALVERSRCGLSVALLLLKRAQRSRRHLLPAQVADQPAVA